MKKEIFEDLIELSYSSNNMKDTYIDLKEINENQNLMVEILPFYKYNKKTLHVLKYKIIGVLHFLNVEKQKGISYEITYNGYIKSSDKKIVNTQVEFINYGYIDNNYSELKVHCYENTKFLKTVTYSKNSTFFNKFLETYNKLQGVVNV